MAVLLSSVYHTSCIFLLHHSCSVAPIFKLCHGHKMAAGVPSIPSEFRETREQNVSASQLIQLFSALSLTSDCQERLRKVVVSPSHKA